MTGWCPLSERETVYVEYQTTHVIITCANRMNQQIPTYFQLGQVLGNSQADRAHRWTARLAEADATAKIAAANLYAGEHWSVARRFPSMNLPGEEIRLWSCSAGYGLISAEASIIPHHATLTRGQADSVPGDAVSWWSLIGEWDGPQSGQPRSICALVSSDPAATFILVLSKNYLRACHVDITMACEALVDPDRFFIVSAGGRPEGSLAAFAVPADARLQALFGGTRRALNARIGFYLLEHGIRSKEEASEQLRRLLARSTFPPAL